MGKGKQLFDTLIDINDKLIKEMEEFGGDTPDSQLDYLNSKIDSAIQRRDRRMLNILGIIMGYIMEEMVNNAWQEDSLSEG